MHVGDGPGAELRADVEHLTKSGLAVTKHGEELATSHTAADARVESAAGGWQGLSSAALATRSEAWVANTNALLTRLGAHAEALHRCAQTFAEMEHGHTAAIEAVHPGGRAASSPGVDPRDM